MPDVDATQRTAAAFEAAFDARPDGVWSAPGRVNLIGEHTDYNGGASLPFAIDRRATVAVRLRTDRVVRVASDVADGVVETDLDDVRQATGWSAYPLGVAWALGEHLREHRSPSEHPAAAAGPDPSELRGFDAWISSTVPVGVGVSSSAALEAAVCLALDELWGLGLDRSTMVLLCQRAENEVVGAPTGTLDQSAALLTAADAAVLLDFADGSAEQVPLGFAAAGLAVLVIDSTIRHDHATGGYGERRHECEEAARIAGVRTLRAIAVDDVDAWEPRMPPAVFRRMRHVVTDTARTFEVADLVRSGRAADIGPILTDGHRSQRDDFEDSVPAIDAAVDAAIDAGALGARLTGGGFGGACIALVREDDAERIGEVVAAAVVAAGHPHPIVFAVRASDGARRDDARDGGHVGRDRAGEDRA